MPRLDRRFTGFDMLRFFDKNLPLVDKQLVVAFFFSLLPRKNPNREAIDFLLDLVGLVPGAGTIRSVFRVTATTAQVVIDVAEIFGIGITDELADLVQELVQLRTLVDDLQQQRDQFRSEARALEVEVVNLRGDNDFLRSLLQSQQALEQRIDQLEAENDALVNQVIAAQEIGREFRPCLIRALDISRRHAPIAVDRTLDDCRILLFQTR